MLTLIAFLFMQISILQKEIVLIHWKSIELMHFSMEDNSLFLQNPVLLM